MGSEDNYSTFKQLICNTFADEKNYMHLWSYSLPPYYTGADFIDKIEPRDDSRGKVIIFVMVQIMGKDTMMYVR